MGILWKFADGSGSEETLLPTEIVPNPTSVSTDGRVLVFSRADPKSGNDIWALPLDGERKPVPYLQSRFAEMAPILSPDGRWIAYFSDESGRSEVYVQPFPGPGGKWLISSEGGSNPVWARNGRELFYRNVTRMMAVDITTDPAFRAGTPRMLFDGPQYRDAAGRADFDVSPDGQRFLMLKEAEQQPGALTQLHVVLNWFEELKRRVPVTSDK
jgi:hypothetical protein